MKKKKLIIEAEDETSTAKTNAEQPPAEKENADGKSTDNSAEETQLLKKFIGLLKAEGFEKPNRHKPVLIYKYQLKNKWFKGNANIIISITYPIIKKNKTVQTAEESIEFRNLISNIIFEETDGNIIKINIDVKSDIPQLSDYAFSSDNVEITSENCNTQQVKELIKKAIDGYRDVIPEDKEKYLRMSKSEKTDSFNRKQEAVRSAIKTAFDELSEEEQDALYNYFPKLSDFLMGGNE